MLGKPLLAVWILFVVAIVSKEAIGQTLQQCKDLGGEDRASIDEMLKATKFPEKAREHLIGLGDWKTRVASVCIFQRQNWIDARKLCATKSPACASTDEPNPDTTTPYCRCARKFKLY